MVKIIQKDYPWTIIIEDKISKNHTEEKDCLYIYNDNFSEKTNGQT